MVWIIIILILAGTAVGMFFLAKALLGLIRQEEEHRKSEDIFATYSYTDEEWEHLYKSEFVDDERAKGFFGPYSHVISIGTHESIDSAKKIHFSDRAIYLTDGQKRKSFAVNRLNLYGNGIVLTSLRPLYLSPLNRLEIKVHIDFLGDEIRVDMDLDYLVPIPRSAADNIDEILARYGKIILGS